jgi:SAM-dependent methyltransferase
VIQQQQDAAGPREFDRAKYEAAYRDRVLGNSFVEEPRYYRIQAPRYRSTMKYLCRLPLPRTANVLEIGGGQMALLLQAMFGDRGTVADISPKFSAAVTKHGLRFVECDLLHDDLPDREAFDLVVICEVIEHLPVPLHLVLRKVMRWMKPGGVLFVTTPNLYRLRNIVRLAQGREIFCYNFYPERGSGLGHPFEFFASHLKWQLEQAGLRDTNVEFAQLSNTGFGIVAKVERWLSAPLLALQPRFRDGLVAWGTRPAAGMQESTVDPRWRAGAGAPS